ncbi:hypothetical protein R6Q59_002648 [Mikania micrantha]
MKVKFEPHQTHLSEELVLLVEKHLEQKIMWVSLSADFKWHVKERKVELDYGGYKHARFACYFPALDENYIQRINPLGRGLSLRITGHKFNIMQMCNYSVF